MQCHPLYGGSLIWKLIFEGIKNWYNKNRIFKYKYYIYFCIIGTIDINRKKKCIMISARDIKQAYSVLKDVVVLTPLDFNRYLSERYGASIYIKREK